MAKIPGAATDFRVNPTQYHELKFEQGCFGARWPGYNSPLGAAGVAPKSLNSLKPDTYFLITWFDKLHYVSPTLYEKDADIYNMLHWKEALILAQDIEGQQAIYDEWADPSGFMDHMVAASVYHYGQATDMVKSWFTEIKRAPKPDPAEFRKLVDRTYDVLELIAKNDLQVDKTIKNGLDLAAIRADLRRLCHMVDEFRNRAIGSAEQITAGLETVESTSFQLLDIVPTITFMDPLREAAYKITTLLVRTAARGAGGALAYGTKQAFLNEALGVLKREVPGLITNILLSPVNRLTKALGMGEVARDAVFLVLQQIVEFTCGLVTTIINNKGKKLTRDQWEHLLVERLSSLVGVLCMRLFRVKLNDKNVKVAVAATVEGLAKVLTSEIYTIYKTCEDQDRDVAEVVLAELPTLIMRLAEAVLVGFAQRKASQAAEYVQTQRVTEQNDLTEAATIAKKTKVSQIWNSKVSRESLMDIRSGRARAIPFTMWEYTSIHWKQADKDLTWRDTNLEYEAAAGVRRFADECQMFCFFHPPNKSRLNHTEHPSDKGAKWGKPMEVPAKSADGEGLPPELAGLVMKPKDGPPGVKTHKKVGAAQATWDKAAPNMARNGMMVRPDGVLFHTDQLELWAEISPWDLAAVRGAVPLLHNLQNQGVWDISNDAEPSQAAKLSQLIADGKVAQDQLDAAKDLLQRAKIGFYSDLDPIDFVDAKSGESKHFGNKPKEAMDIAAENRRLINEYVSKDLKGIDIESDPRQSGAPGVGGDPDHRYEHPESEVLHGASLQCWGKGVPASEQLAKMKDGTFGAGPGAELVFFFNKVPPDKLAAMSDGERDDAVHNDIADQIDKYLKEKIGDKKVKDHIRRVDAIKKEYRPLSHKVKKGKLSPPPITTEQIEESNKMVDGIEVLEEKGLTYEVTELAVLNSLHVRGLNIGEHSILQAAVPTSKLKTGAYATSPGDLENAKQSFGTFIGIDRKENNIVIAARHYTGSLASAIACLVNTRRAIGTVYDANNSGHLRFWYEIYSAYRPVTVGYVRDRIGGPSTGLPGLFDGLADQAPTFAKPKDKRIYAFCIRGVVETYTPEVKDIGKFQGLWLHEVLEDTTKLTLSDRPVSIIEAGQPNYIALFTSPIEDDSTLCAPYHSDADKKAAIEAAKEKSREKQEAAMAASN